MKLLAAILGASLVGLSLAAAPGPAPRAQSRAGAAPAARQAAAPAAVAPARPSAAGANRAVAGGLSAEAQNDLVETYCINCHNDNRKSGGQSFERFDAAAVVEHAEVTERMIRKVRAGMMPPANAKRPDPATARAFVTALEDRLDRAARPKPNPGLDAVKALIDAGADVNQVSAGDGTSPLLIATLNGHFDLAMYLLDRGADPNIAAENGATALYDAINLQWGPKSLYPQPTAHQQQRTTYLALMKALLDRSADPNARLRKKVWYTGYSFDSSGVDEIGATAFWRAAYGSDVDAMKLLVAYGADPNIPTMKPVGRPRTGDVNREFKDMSGLPPVPLGGPAVPPIHAAAGTGYGEGFAANSHRYAPTGMLAAMKYLVEELHADVNTVDHEGNTVVHLAAARGDNEMITYLVSKGADVTKVNREGKTTADMANGPVQRTQPFPETIALLEKLGAKNNHKCVSC